MTSFSIDRKNDIVAIENSKVKAIFQKKDGTITQVFYAKHNNKWQQVVSAFVPPENYSDDAVQLFNQDIGGHRYLVNSLFTDVSVQKNGKKSSVILTGSKGKVPIEQTITLSEEDGHFHFAVKLDLIEKPAKLDYALSTFTFDIGRTPEFVHTPGLKFDNEDSKQNRFKLLPGKDHIIGDRAFHAPAIILQEGELFVSLAPDLNAINANKNVSPDARRNIEIPRNQFSVPIEEDKFTMPTGLDLNVKTGLTKNPVMTFGYMDNIIAHHIHYQRVNDESMTRVVNDNNVRYEFDLFISADEPPMRGFQKISRHHWAKFGKPVFEERPHLAMPFEDYVKIIDSITLRSNVYNNIDIPLEDYKDNGSWVEWEMDGLKVGGYRSAINWWNDVIHNSAFWNNARDASGFWYWGNKLDRPDLIEKGRQIINFCLSAPRNEQGMFALLYSLNDKKWGLGFTDPVNNQNKFFLRESDSYDISTMSKTAAHLLDYHLRSERDQRIVDYLIPYGDWLLSEIDGRGAVPSYVDRRNLVSSPILKYSAQPSSSMWFLAELYNATGDHRYMEGAKKIGVYLESEILPEQKWVDMEQFFSCGERPFEFDRDYWQNQVARGNLALFWAIEGYAALYRATGDPRILKLGEQCVDYATFTQACWEPHFIYTAFPFGGFTVDNTDNATLLDARQAEMVKSFIWYGKTLGRQDLLERGVAAARSSVVLINHPRHKANNIYRHTNIYPFGLGPENIDHEAHAQSAMRTHPGWGEGSGVFTGLAEAHRALGGIYLDLKKELYVGVDGLRVDKVSAEGNTIKLEITNMLRELPLPWTKPLDMDLRVHGLEKEYYNLIINNVSYGRISRSELENYQIRTDPS
ncbi:MAG TPA: hypothetical protein VKZ93_02070 [Arenibacter sp.]|nr:hypothetical protein [Arenibacter sp.]